ncbi:MAG: hypothetical protein DRI94_11845 [Bacteroidetes bacterium]|nr:MAG: hypothetical protein DRI94_11845 [Bacteroidota bacterium]
MKKIFLLVFLLSFITKSFSCTNFIVTKGASVDGSAYIVYTNDGEWLYHLQKFAAKDYKSGEWRKTGSGKIPQVLHTYASLGFHMNEYQLSIGETTFTGREELWNKKGFIKYWHLMKLALERAKNAREAIRVITTIVDKYGYGSEGESFSIVDPNEAWILEMIGRGENEKGAVWVAVKIPDGYVSAHANMSRIGESQMNDTSVCYHSKDIIKFATDTGYYDLKNPRPFRFNEIFNPATPERLKYCESRVWSIFNRVAPSLNLSTDYCRGVKGASRYPLYVRPDKKLNFKDVANIIRDHYEATPFDMTKGIQAGAFGNPNRVRPLNWEVNGEKHQWERAISTYNSAFSFIAQMRSWLPNNIGGIVWFGEDDTYSTCYLPMYVGINKIPEAYTIGDINKFSWKSAWWVFNFVANFANIRYVDMIKDIQKVQHQHENLYISQIDSIDVKAKELLKTSGKEKSNEFLTNYVKLSGDKLVADWINLGEFLITKYNDGYVKDEKNQIKQTGYPQDWYNKVNNYNKNCK